MDKRYQVFVSSTYEDLQEERKEVMQALLELDCIPAGMELFPASNEDQWSLIKRVIDDSDYYIVIVGGRYGSTNKDGISYTEMEYRYALETNKPIIAFLHKNPDDIKSKYTEKTQDGKEKLDSFRELAQQKMVKFWTSPTELGSVVSRSMVKLMKQFPAVGWVRADAIVDETSMREILKLRKENDELKNQVTLNKVNAPKGTENLSQGEDETYLSIKYQADIKQKRYLISDKIFITWNDLFSIISPYLTNECTESMMKYAIRNHIKEIIGKEKKNEYENICNFEINEEEFQRIKIQFKALGLITQSTKSRSVKDTANYWTLTEYGDYVMTQVIAIKRTEYSDT